MDLGFRRLYWRIALYISIALVAFVLLGIVSVGLVASSQLENYAATRQSPLGRPRFRRHLGGFDSGQNVVGNLGRPIDLPVAALQARVLLGRQQHEVIAAILGDGDRLNQRLGYAQKPAE